MKSKALFFSLFLWICFGAFCQQKSYIYFDSIYNSTNNNICGGFTVYETNDGYFAAGGANMIYQVIFIQKTDKQGQSIGVKIFKKSGFNLWVGGEGSLIKTNDGGYALGGGITSSINDKVLLMRFNANGDTLWTKEFGDNISGSFYTARQCKQTKDKGYIIVGEKEISTSNEDVLIIKTDSMGNMQWQKTYGGTNMDYGWTIAVTPDSGFIIGGYTEIYTANYSRNALVIKTDSTGNQQWQKVFGGPFDDGLAVVAVAKDSNFIVGFAYSTDQPYPTECGDYRFNVLKLNPSGDVVWNKKYAEVRFCSAINNINVLNDGNIIVAGYGNPYTNGGNVWRKGMVLKIENNGDSVWMRDYERVHNMGSENKINHILQTSDNGLIACGEIFGAWEPPNGQNMWLLKMDSFGCLEPNCDGVNITEPVVNDNKGFKIYPNPAQDKININLPGFENLAGLHLVIYNIQGQLLLQQDLKQNNNEIEISKLEPGIYIAKIKLNDGSFLQERFVVIK